MKTAIAYIAAWMIMSTVLLVGMKWAGVPGYAEVGHSWWYLLGGLVCGLVTIPLAEWILENVK